MFVVYVVTMGSTCLPCATLQVRAQLQSLPGSPAQATRLAALHTAAVELKSKAAKMKAKSVPRPAPPQYAQIMQSMQQFLTGSGSVQRMQGLLERLQVNSKSVCTAAAVPQRYHSTMAAP